MIGLTQEEQKGSSLEIDKKKKKELEEKLFGKDEK